MSTFTPLPPLLIGLTGRAGAGKTTVAHFLEDQYAFCDIALASPIVNMIGSLFADAGISGAWMVERGLKELPTPLGFSYRRLAQTLGTEWGRALAHDFWLRVATARITAPHLVGENIVVSDIRFPNEAAWLQARGGKLVRIVRDHTPAVAAHESESHSDSLPADAELINTGSKETLFEQVDRLMAQLRKD
jgi:hypothetical protein